MKRHFKRELNYKDIFFDIIKPLTWTQNKNLNNEKVPF